MPILITLRMRLPVVALPIAAADAVGKIGHLVEDGMNLRHDVLAIHNN